MTNRKVILHVLEASGPPGSRRVSAVPEGLARASLRCVPEHEHRAAVIGGSADQGSLAMPACTIGSPFGDPLLGWRGIRRAIREAGRGVILQTYSARASAAARLASLGTSARVTWLDVGAQEGRRFASAGVLRVGIGEQVAGVETTARRVPVPRLAAQIPESRRLEARRGLEVGDDEMVVTVLEEPSQATDARWFVFLGGILIAAGIPMTLIVPPGAGNIARMRRFHATTRLGLRVIVAVSGVKDMLAAADAAICLPPAHESGARQREGLRLSVMHAHQSGLPVVMPREIASASGISEEAARILAASAPTTRQYAASLAKLALDPTLRARLRNEAGMTAADDEGFGAGLRDAYRVCASQDRAHAASPAGATTA